MNTPRWMALAALICLAPLAARAAAIDGTWKWTIEVQGEQHEVSVDLHEDNGALSGTYHSRSGATAISHGSLKEDTVSFTLERSRGDTKYVVRYTGKLSGDTISGTIERGTADGPVDATVAWNATRAK